MTDLLPDQLPPERKPAFYPTSSGGDGVEVRVTCIPPLAQATQVAKEKTGVKFAVLLEIQAPVWSAKTSLKYASGTITMAITTGLN